jgi:hypothetical protein
VDFFITWSLALGLLVVPGLINYFVNRYYTPPGTSMASTLELVAASLTLKGQSPARRARTKRSRAAPWFPARSAVSSREQDCGNKSA